MADDVVYSAALDDTDILKSLQRIEKGVNDIAKRGDKSFGDLGKSVAKTTVNLDRLKSSADAIVQSLIRVGEQVVKAFTSAVQKGIELNKEAELVQISLTNIFEGNEKAAQAFLSLIDQTAVKIGASRQELRSIAKGILPDVGNIQTTNELLQNTIVLGRDAGATFQSIRIALEEALSGNLSSLQRRLNIPKATLDNAEKYAETLGVAGGLAKALAERVEQTGLSVEATAGSLEVLLGGLQSEVTNLQTILGEPAAEELKEQISGILQAVEDNRDNIEIVAKAFGEMAAKVIEIVGSGITNAINNLDYEQAEQLADNFSKLLDTVKLLVDILADPDLLNGIIEATNTLVSALQQALFTAAQIATLVQAELAASEAAREKLTELGRFDPSRGRLRPGGLDPTEQAEVEAAAEEARRQVILDQIVAFEEFDKAQQKNIETARKRREKTEETTQADLDAANAVIERKAAEDELAKAQGEAAEAQEKIGAAKEKFARETERRLTKILVDAERDRLDEIIKNAQAREDIARENAQAVEDIERKHQQEISDAATDLGRDLEDIARKNSRQRVEIDRDLANSRLDAERQFRLELQRIRDQFAQSALDAERNNDAQAFLQAVRARDEQITQAEARRDESIESAEIEAGRRQEALRVSLEQEIEDAQIANQRKLEDLQLSLERELEEQRIANQRALEEQAIREQRAAEQRELALQRELEDFNQAQAQKQADLQRSLETELATVQRYEKLKADTMIAEAQRAFDTVKKLRQSFFGGSSASASEALSSIPLVTFTGQTRQHGGPVEAGQPYRVGEAGEEVFVPNQDGMIIPNNALYAPPVPGGGGQVNQVSNTYNPTFNLAESIFNDPVAREQLRNFVLGTLLESA